jgi:chitin synthase
MKLAIKNQSSVVQATAVHTSGQLQSQTGSALHAADWYTAKFKPKIQNFYKGPVVYTSKELKAFAADQNMQKCVFFVGFPFRSALTRNTESGDSTTTGSMI